VFSDASLTVLMKRAGILDQPTIFFLEDVEDCAL